MMSKIIIVSVVVIGIVAAGAWALMRKDNPLSDDTPSGYSRTEEAIVPSPADETAPNPASQPTATTPSPGPAIKEFTITGQNYSFAPSALTVRKGDTVKIIFKNTGGTHDLRIDEFGMATKRTKSGEEDTLTFVADKTGSFEYYCSIGSHRQMGMKGTLVVTE